MQPTSIFPKASPITTLWATILMVTFVWCATFATMMRWEIQEEHDAFRELLFLRANMLHQNVRSIQHWIGTHGGIYVQPDDGDESAQTVAANGSQAESGAPSYDKMEFLTPTEFLRNIYDEFQSLNGTRVRLVSSNAINPDNEPLEWEAEGLAALGSGADEFVQRVRGDDLRSFRLMRPITLKPKCMACHGNYDPDDVGKMVGAISIDLDVTEDSKVRDRATLAMLGNHAWLWLFGMAMIGAIAVGWRRILVKLDNLATRDPLTRLLNRNTLMEALDREVARNSRDNSGLAVMMLDIDHFKNVNDTYGHQAGDEVLRGVSALLGDKIRSFDTVGRYGGEEFLIVCPNLDISGATAIAERIRSTIETSAMDTICGKVPVTASIGVATIDHARTSDDLVSAADAAMYDAKGNGRNCVCVADSNMVARIGRTREARGHRNSAASLAARMPQNAV